MANRTDWPSNTTRWGVAPAPVDVRSRPNLAEAISGMVQALGDEVDAMTHNPRHAPIPLSQGTRVQADAFGATYRFSAARRPRLREGAEALIRTAEREYTAIVASPACRQDREWAIELRLGSNLGAEAPAGKLIFDKSWMKLRLAKFLVEPGGVRNLPLASAAIGIIPGPAIGGTRAPLPSGLDLTLNLDQCAAVELSLNRSVAHVWGPPGTGKTFTMAHCALAHAALGRSVLVVAPSNAATDVAALQIARLLKRDPRLDNGFLLRLGPVTNPDLHGQYGDQVEYSQVTRRLAIEHGHLPAVAEKLLRGCHILLTTIQRTYLNRLVGSRPYDVVLIDEAGMCQLPDVFAASSLASTHVTFFGDFRQLPGVVMAETPAARRWLRRDSFEAHHLHERALAGDSTPGMVMLTEQRRMAPSIASVVSEGWYGGLLTSDIALRRRPSPFTDIRSSVSLIDTSALRPRAVMANGERTNPVHAAVVGALLDELTDGAGAGFKSDGAPSIAVLTPYCGQTDLLHQALRRRRLARRLRVSTVHAAQGDEYDAVILDLCDATGAGLSRFLRARRLEDDGARLLNVALSRARHRLYLVADVTFLMREAPATGPVRRLLTRLTDDHAVEDAAALMGGMKRMAG